MLHHIIDTPFEELKFVDFASVKSGRDKFSKMNLDDLIVLTPVNDYKLLYKAFNTDDKSLAVALRWYHRGLTDTEKIVRLVKIKNEISTKVKRATIDQQINQFNIDKKIQELQEQIYLWKENPKHP